MRILVDALFATMCCWCDSDSETIPAAANGEEAEREMEDFASGSAREIDDTRRAKAERSRSPAIQSSDCL